MIPNPPPAARLRRVFLRFSSRACATRKSRDVETDGQVGGMLAAYDASNREVWRLKVYENPRRPELEGDVQDVWFRSLRVERGKLLIENERGERFEVDPATRHVLGQPVAPAVELKPDIDPISGEPRIRRPG